MKIKCPRGHILEVENINTYIKCHCGYATNIGAVDFQKDQSKKRSWEVKNE